jgi:hypothetical protein
VSRTTHLPNRTQAHTHTASAGTRHCFALKWFCILSLVEERRLEGFSAEEIEDFRDQLGDIWLQMSILLGHKHPDTSREHYLEPFTGLQVSYLMALLDDDEQAGVDALVRVFARHGGSTIAPVAASAAAGSVRGGHGGPR